MPGGGGGGALPKRRLPAPTKVVAEFALVPGRGVSGTAAMRGVAAPPRYRIIRTTEVDQYEGPVPASAIPGLTVPRAPPAGNAFRGTARKAAKLSIATARTEPFPDLAGLLATLPSHRTMTRNRTYRRKRITTGWPRSGGMPG